MEYLNLNEIEKSCPAALTQKQSSKLSHILQVYPYNRSSRYFRGTRMGTHTGSPNENQKWV
jgi:hypothetical protein